MNNDDDKWRPWLKRRSEAPEDVASFIKELLAAEHTYSSCVYATAGAALAAGHLMASRLGITGFQAGCVMWEFVREWLDLDGVVRLVQYRDMLYPQYESKFAKAITPDVWEDLQSEARKLLAKERRNGASSPVVAHWQSIVDGRVPFGYEVRDR